MSCFSVGYNPNSPINAPRNIGVPKTEQKTSSKSSPPTANLAPLKPVPKFYSVYTSFNVDAEHSDVYSTLITCLRSKKDPKMSFEEFPQTNVVLLDI